jgi:hypothetical protein
VYQVQLAPAPVQAGVVCVLKYGRDTYFTRLRLSYSVRTRRQPSVLRSACSSASTSRPSTSRYVTRVGAVWVEPFCTWVVTFRAASALTTS